MFGNIIPCPNSNKSMLLAQELDDYQIAEMMSHPGYTEVVAGRFPDGNMVKITGHLRDFLWHTGRATEPSHIKVHELIIPDMETAMELYDHLNGDDGWPRFWMTDTWQETFARFPCT